MKPQKRYINLLLLAITLSFAMIFSSCSSDLPDNSDYSSDLSSEDVLLTGGDEIQKFSSDYELKEFLKNNYEKSEEYYGSSFSISLYDNAESLDSVATAKTAAGSSSSESSVAQDYSQTNIQVEGVDEADFVKNDNQYIYMLSQNKLIIVDAFPGSDATILSQTEIAGYPQQLFIKDDRLVIFTDDYEETYTIEEFDYIPRKKRESITHIMVYDVSNRKNPELIKDYTINGNYYESRMIGDYVYFISKEPIYYYDDIIIPMIKESGFRIASPEVYYFDNPEDSYIFHTVGSLNLIEDKSTILAKTFMLGYSNNLYFSKDNLYISYQKNFPYSYYEYMKVDMFFKIIVPKLPSNIQDEIKKVEEDLKMDSKQSYIEAWDKISVILENMYNYMDEDEKEDLVNKIEEAVVDYKTQIEEERRQTIIHKIGVTDGMIEYKMRGEVKGSLLNQFSLDEYGGYLRVATTTYYYNRENSGPSMHNNVYVLEEGYDKLEVVGKLEKLAPDEKIYSTRFVNDRLYMVTFKRTDPLFTIDLSSPTQPKILGQLKIPGYSNYLHPYDENHLIGIGQDTYENERGSITTKGVKLSLFDVSDITNPAEIDTLTIGDSGSYSEVLYDHKALLFDKEKNLLALPIREVSEDYSYDDNGYFREDVWNGAYVFTITKNGFKERGKITHNSNEDDSYYYWSSPYNVRRLMFMDDNLYSISSEYIKVNDLGTIEEIGEVKLPYNNDWYPYKESEILISDDIRMIK